jgi:cyclin-dependent kinase 8/11
MYGLCRLQNWVIHRDLKPSNILVMGDGPEQVLSHLQPWRLPHASLDDVQHCWYLAAHKHGFAKLQLTCIQGKVKVGDFGLARFVREPLRPLAENGVVVSGTCMSSLCH